MQQSQGILGMSIVGSDHEQLRRYNLAEISDPAGRLDNTETQTFTEQESSESMRIESEEGAQMDLHAPPSGMSVG